HALRAARRVGAALAARRVEAPPVPYNSQQSALWRTLEAGASPSRCRETRWTGAKVRLRMAQTTIPGSLGLPYIGETVALFSDPLRFVAKRRQRYGMVFKTRLLGGHPAVVLPGADAQQLVLVSGGAHSPFRAGMGYQTLEPFLGRSLLQL